MAPRRAGASTLAIVTIALLPVASFGAAAAGSRPNFSGVWFSVQNTHHENISAETMFKKATGIKAPPGGWPHVKPHYAESFKAAIRRAEEADARGVVLADTETQCRPDGMPKMMRAILPIEVVQSAKQVMVVTEEMSQVRRIYLDEKMPPAEEISPSYNGYSVGHWDGDTLIIDTIGIRGDVSFMFLPNSGKMKLTERMRLQNPNLLELTINLEDPEVLEKPYRLTWTYTRDDSHKILEYVCDNNRYAPGKDDAATLNIDIPQ